MNKGILKNLHTKVIGQNYIFLEEVSSTQDYVKEAEKQGAPEGLVVAANNQTKGYGTHSRTWYTKRNENLTFSVLLRPNCSIEKMGNLTVIIAKTILSTIKRLYGYELDIKEPNDIMINKKKCGGILTEAVSSNDKIKFIVIGIGLNVNQTSFNEEIRKIATSLKKEFKREFDKEEILVEFLNEFEMEYMNML